MRLHGRVLTIAGSDCSGGAGVQADIKTITALGAYATTAITAITVQDTTAVHAIHPLPPALIAAQIACALTNPGADAIKTGMLVDAPTIQAVAAVLSQHAKGIPLVIDPVLTATTGTQLLAINALETLRHLFPLATLITPNAPEAAALCGHEVATLADMRAAAAILRAAGAPAVLIKGAHIPGDTITDLLATLEGETLFTHPRQPARHPHGTGCTLSAAIATGLAQSLPLTQATGRAIAYLQAAIREAPPGGPLNHAVTVHPFDHPSPPGPTA